jgi:RNA polymerase sigma factor (TIGR02999 family)
MDRAEGRTITLLLRRAAAGDEDAEARLVEALYRVLRGMARRLRRGRPGGATLQTTALVHEVWIRLLRHERAGYESRAHFLASAGRAMRSVMVDHLRGRRRTKRGARWKRVPLDGMVLAFEERSVDLLDLDAALRALEAEDPEAARVVEMRFFGGMSVAEAAERLGVSTRTVVRDWEFARAWLHRALG